VDSKVIAPLSDERRTELLARLLIEPSDTKLALEFGISRKTLWRMRQAQKNPASPVPTAVMTPPAPGAAVKLPPVVIPPIKVPKVAVPKVPKSPVTPKTPTPEAVVTSEIVTPEVVPEVVKAVPTLVPPFPEDPRPKVDVEPVYLNTFFAIQLLRGESHKQVANVVLTEAEAKGVLFRKLQVLDIVSVGTTAFVRFRGDLPNAFAVVKTLQDRAIIVINADGTYTVTFPNGKSGKFPGSAMCSSPKVGFGHTYAGTRIKRWKQQFAA
jgi:hypothetical protein